MPVVPCTNTPPVVGVVAFDPAIFKVLYPEFSMTDDAILQNDFAIATLLLNNSCGSRVCDANQRETLLNMLVAHIAFLGTGSNGTPAPGIVGRINTATEGSVSVGAEFDGPQSAQYYLQTKYGALFWAATARYRTMRYFPGASSCGPAFPNGGQGWPGFGPGSYGFGGDCGC